MYNSAMDCNPSRVPRLLLEKVSEKVLLTSQEEEVLLALLSVFLDTGKLPEKIRYEIQNEERLDIIDELKGRGLMRVERNHYYVTVRGLAQLDAKDSETVLSLVRPLLDWLRGEFRAAGKEPLVLSLANVPTPATQGENDLVVALFYADACGYITGREYDTDSGLLTGTITIDGGILRAEDPQEVLKQYLPVPGDKPQGFNLIGTPSQGGISWQVTEDHWAERDYIRLAFHFSSFSRLKEREARERLAAVAENELPWLAPGRRTWKVELRRLKDEFKFLRHLSWLDEDVAEVEPEFEDNDNGGLIKFTLTPHTFVGEVLPEDARLRVLVFHGPDNTSKHELLAWLRGPTIQADARTAGEMPAHSDGAVDQRVDQMIEWADKAIAIVTPDDRSRSGAPNVIDEIGRWRGRGRAAELAIVRQRTCDDIWSNLAGVVRVEFESRVNEVFLKLADFLGSLEPARRS